MKVLCVHSFAVHGTASLKAILSILGTRVLPVPSLYLSGLTNIPGYIKTEVNVQELLISSLDLARSRGDRILLYVGYLGNAEQAKIIVQAIEDYRDIIEKILVDPVSGDHGRMYVPDAVLGVWPELLSMADWAFPNYTELQLYSALEPSSSHAPQDYLEAFQKRFPQLSLVVTSLPDKKRNTQELGVGLFHQAQSSLFHHSQVAAHYGGTGDVFVAYFILFAFFEKISLVDAMEKAALNTLAIIEGSLKLGSPDLIIHPKV